MSKHKYPDLVGTLTVGGLYAGAMSGITGILTGKVIRTSRDEAIPYASAETISEWASEQAKLVPNLYREPEVLMECAQFICMLGGDTGDLPIAYYQGKWMSFSDLQAAKNLPDEICLVDPYMIEEYEQIEGFRPLPNIIVGEYSGIPEILGFNRFSNREWPKLNKPGYEHFSLSFRRFFIFNLSGRVIEAIFQNWKLELADQYSLEDDIAEGDKTLIGYIGNSPVKVFGTVIRKPNKS